MARNELLNSVYENEETLQETFTIKKLGATKVKRPPSMFQSKSLAKIKQT